MATKIESKIPGVTNLAINAGLNTKTTGTENKILDTTGFITTPEFNRLIKKIDATVKQEAKILAIR